MRIFQPTHSDPIVMISYPSPSNKKTSVPTILSFLAEVKASMYTFYSLSSQLLEDFTVSKRLTTVSN